MDGDDKPIDRGSSRKLHSNSSTVAGTDFLETNKADRAMWLLKCPQVVTRALSNSPDDPSRPVAKVIVSVDPLQSNDDDDSSSTEVYNVILLWRFWFWIGGSLLTIITTEYLPDGINSSFNLGKFTVEGKILNKFDMKPHDQNLDSYGKLCRERTHKSMTKSRQIQVIDHVTGGHMRPMPGMDVLSFGAAEKKKVVSKGSENKRLRKERGELEKIIFRLFERQPYWTSKQLIQETDQPEVSFILNLHTHLVLSLRL
ncbi:tfg2, partial [Cucurbita argyrosperma subsp. argyrosperma]